MLVRDWFDFFMLICSGIIVDGRSNLFLKKFERCDSKANYAAKYNFTFKTISSIQYLDGTLNLARPLDNTLRFNVSIDILIGKNYVYLFSINEKKSCDAMHKFLGEFMYDLERQAQLIPGMCPIPKGRYQWHNCQLDFEKITTLANFPFGNLRSTGVIYNKDNSVYLCIVAEVEHRMF